MIQLDSDLFPSWTFLQSYSILGLSWSDSLTDRRVTLKEITPFKPAFSSELRSELFKENPKQGQNSGTEGETEHVFPFFFFCTIDQMASGAVKHFEVQALIVTVSVVLCLR